MNRSLILGLLALVILCVLCLWCRAPAIEDDLRGKALICVEDAGADAGVLAVSGRDVTLEGAVASQAVGDSVEACIAAAEKLMSHVREWLSANRHDLV